MLSIHYKGSCEPKVMQKLISELKAISEEMQWKYTIIEDEKFLGIIISFEEKCEPLYFIINNQGRLINLAWLNDENPDDAAYYIAVKTNFSTIDIHIVIVKLLKYVKQKYIQNLEVTDEGDYYETENKEILTQKWNLLLEKFKEVSQLLENNFKSENQVLTTDELIEKIENLLDKYLNDNE